MRHRISLISGVLLLAAMPLLASHGWSTYHWGRPCTSATGCEAQITVYSSMTVSNTDWPTRLNRVVYGWANPNTANQRGWNDSSVLALSLTGGATDSGTRSSCPAVSGAVRVCNYTYGSTGWLGLAQINTVSGTSHIAWGTAKMNDSYFNTGSYPGTEKQHVVCQEVGHDFGLGHTSENGSSQNTCMDYYQNTSSTDYTSTGPNQHDFDQLLTQHHATAIASPAYGLLSMVSAAADSDGNLDAPWQWGTPFEFDPQGRPSAFELDLGD